LLFLGYQENIQLERQMEYMVQENGNKHSTLQLISLNLANREPLNPFITHLTSFSQ